MKYSVLIEVNVTVNDMDEARDIAKDIHDIISDAGITNSVNVTDEISE